MEPVTERYLEPLVYSPHSHPISLNIHFNVILQSVPPKWYHPVRFTDDNDICIFRLPHVRHTSVGFVVEMQT